MNKIILSVALAMGASSAFALRTPPVVITAPPVAASFASGSLVAGQTDTITFQLASVADDLFAVSFGPGGSYASTSFALYSGSTLLTSTTTPTGVGAYVADYAGLTVGGIYTIVLTSTAATTYTISSLDKVVDGSVTITPSLPGGPSAVPEADAGLMALAGLGVAGAVAWARRRKQAA